MLCCTCARTETAMPEGGSLPELASRELSQQLLDGEAKLEQGSFEEAEVTLREALSINNEVILFAILPFASRSLVRVYVTKGLNT